MYLFPHICGVFNELIWLLAASSTCCLVDACGVWWGYMAKRNCIMVGARTCKELGPLYAASCCYICCIIVLQAGWTSSDSIAQCRGSWCESVLVRVSRSVPCSAYPGHTHGTTTCVSYNTIQYNQHRKNKEVSHMAIERILHEGSVNKGISKQRVRNRIYKGYFTHRNLR